MKKKEKKRTLNFFFIFVQGLALASLLTVQNELIYERFNGIILNISEALNDIMKEDDDSDEMIELVLDSIKCKLKIIIIIFSSLIFTDDCIGIWNMEEFKYQNFHYERYSKLCLTDPVHTIVLKNYVDSQVRHFLHAFLK